MTLKSPVDPQSTCLKPTEVEIRLGFWSLKLIKGQTTNGSSVEAAPGRGRKRTIPRIITKQQVKTQNKHVLSPALGPVVALRAIFKIKQKFPLAE